MRRALFPFAITLLVCMPLGLARAADISIPRSPLPPVAVPAIPSLHDWTGLYVGLQGGYGWGESSGTQNTGGTFFPVVPYTIDPHGFLGGGHVGYNQQINRWVMGIEGDLEAADVNGMSTVNAAGQAYFFNAKADMLGSMRGRIGAVHDKWLVYATGGVAWGNVSTPPLDALDGTRIGYTLGAGLEYAFNPKWSARVEYRFTDLGRESAAGGEPFSFDDNRFSFHAIRAGVSYKLGGPR